MFTKVNHLLRVFLSRGNTTRRVVLATALGVALALGGCDGDGLVGTESRPQSHRAPVGMTRSVDGGRESITLNRDGTYERVVVDKWGQLYTNKGTWRGYGDTVQQGKKQISKSIEIDDYSDARDVMRTRGPHGAPKSTKTLPLGEFFVE